MVRALAGALALGCTLSASLPAMAQNTPGKSEKKGLTPPVPSPPKAPPSHLVGFVFAFLLAGVVIGVNFIPSKRGHQD